MNADIEAANEWCKTPQGSAALYNAGYFAKPHLVRAFIAGWRAKEAAEQTPIVQYKTCRPPSPNSDTGGDPT